MPSPEIINNHTQKEMTPEEIAEIKGALETLERYRNQNSDFRVLQRLEIPRASSWDIQELLKDKEVGKVCIIDTETTGLDTEHDEIIALSVLPLYYNKTTLDILAFGETIMEYNQPQGKISPKITEITGITWDMVEGRSLYTPEMNATLADTVLFIAHNAGFDRKFFERYFDDSQNNWACSFESVSWDANGFDSAKLRHLLADCGYFYDAHRADIDCDALAMLLTQTAPRFVKHDKDEYDETGRTFFYELMENARKPEYVLSIPVSFKQNHIIKAHSAENLAFGLSKYTWNADDKLWEFKGTKEQVVDEIKWGWKRGSFTENLNLQGTPRIRMTNARTRFRSENSSYPVNESDAQIFLAATKPETVELKAPSHLQASGQKAGQPSFL